MVIVEMELFQQFSWMEVWSIWINNLQIRGVRTLFNSNVSLYFLGYCLMVFIFSLFYPVEFDNYILLNLCTAFILYYDVLKGKKPTGLIVFLLLFKFIVLNVIAYYIIEGKSSGTLLGSGYSYVVCYGFPSFLILIIGNPLLMFYYKKYEK